MHGIRSLLVVLLLGTGARAADWPQWLGPNRDGSTTETVAVWKQAPKVLWRQPVGEGHSSPVVASGRVFVHTKVKDKDEEEVAAFDAKVGTPLWKTGYPRAPFKGWFGNGPRGTPALVEDRVYTLGITGILTCFEAGSGKQLWQVDPLKKFQAKNLYFGSSSSPLVDGNRVFVAVGGKGASVVAFDKDKGDVLWQSQDDKASYASPVIFGEGSRRQLVFLTGESVLSLNPVSGAPHWKYPFVDQLNESSTTPVRVGDLLLASSITAGSVGLRLERKEDKPAVEKAWKNDELTCYFSTPIAVGKDHVFLVTGTKPPAVKVHADLRCIEAATGKELWQKPNVGKFHATLLRTGNDMLLMLDDSGNLMLLEPSFQEYKELAKAKVCGDTSAHPALADGRLYVRDGESLICVQLGE